MTGDKKKVSTEVVTALCLKRMCTSISSLWPDIWSSEQLTSKTETKLVVREETSTDTTRIFGNLKKKKGGKSIG